jgi:hypothetical protein
MRFASLVGACLVALCLVTLSACRLPPDRPPLKPLPEDGQQFSYVEILSRARLQATMAVEAFYVDGWVDLEEAAAGLEQTARYLPKATEPPATFKDKVAGEAKVLAKDAFRLRVAAQAKDAKETNDLLQRINLRIRALRPDGDAIPLNRSKVESDK